ncbi:hypothetical protein [Kineococcus esterisolvens]|uniref:hypothetical protein n=1 Tax=unclassified Kineococcus TaxID=2621656 RepID=UPI003D7EED8F
MKAPTRRGKRSVRVQQVPAPRVQHPTGAVARITSTAVRGSTGGLRPDEAAQVVAVTGGIARSAAVRTTASTVRRRLDDVPSPAEDPPGAVDPNTHRPPPTEVPGAHEPFREEEDGCVEVVLQP